jgi:hypothetical protein
MAPWARPRWQCTSGNRERAEILEKNHTLPILYEIIP